MKEIPLGKGLFAKISDRDYKELFRYPWHATWNPKTRSYYAVRTVFRKEGKPYSISMQRQILGLAPYEKTQADHIDHDTLNNQRSNLRGGTDAQNKANHRGYRNNTSGYTGIAWSERHRQYRVCLGRKGYLGYRRTLDEARALRNRVAIERYGEFARLV